MSASFAFRIDRETGLIGITMSGFYAAADIEAFLEARREAHAALGWPPNMHVTLNDVRGMDPQSQTIVDAFTQMLAGPEYRSRRLAFVVAPNLARSQLLRALDSRAGRCFTDPKTAEAWLLEAEALPLAKAS